MLFTEQELELLAQSCYGDPRLPHWLERMLEGGPGTFPWPPEPGYYADEEIPLWQRVLAQILHQGTVYPAGLVAIPVLWQVMQRHPNQPANMLFWMLQEYSTGVARADLSDVPEAVWASFQAVIDESQPAVQFWQAAEAIDAEWLVTITFQDYLESRLSEPKSV